MTSVFLSYDRDDAAKARSIAQALEKAGHSVWWDRHIRGGSRYAAEIEKALSEADAVVVLWSRQSVQSDWVRDEAAKGRDSGRLVPARIDDVEAPLGFGQHQTTDLSGWKGRARDRGFAEMLQAVEALGRPGTGVGPYHTPAPSGAIRVSPRLMVSLAAAALLVLAVALWQPWNSRNSTPTVTVVPGDGSPKSLAIAGNLLVQLGSLQSAGTNALQLVEPGSRAKPDLTFKAGAVGGTVDPRANLSLIDNRAGALLWSREFVQPGGNEADLRQQLAYSAAQVLSCATEAFDPQHRKIERPTLKLYLNGCADLSITEEPQIAVSNFAQVTRQAPGFAGGWAKLLLAKTVELRSQGLNHSRLRRELRSHITQARKVDPTMAEAYLAEGWLQAPRPIIGWLRFSEEAVARHPTHAEALATRSLGLIHVGRTQEAVDDARRAVQIEPLSPSARVSLIQAHMDLGSIRVARNELEKAERLWPGATDLTGSRFALEYRYGDPRQALRMLETGALGSAPTAAQISFLTARIDATEANIERAVSDARTLFQQESRELSSYIQTLAQFGREQELADVLLRVDPRITPGVVTVFFRTAFDNLHNDPRFLAIADRFGLVDYWRTSGKWPDFCSEPGLPYDCKAEAAKLAS